MKRFYGIVGPESSGTRLMTELFVKAGCFGDAPQHKQRLDNVLTCKESLQSIGVKEIDDIVLRRSVPYGSNLWPDLIFINKSFSNIEYLPLWIIVLRDWHCTVKSKINQKHKNDINKANIYLFEEIKYIFFQILQMNTPFYIFDMSLLFERKEKALIRLSEITGLKFDCSDIVNADEKYLIGQITTYPSESRYHDKHWFK